MAPEIPGETHVALAVPIGRLPAPRNRDAPTPGTVLFVPLSNEPIQCFRDQGTRDIEYIFNISFERHHRRREAS
eukprot:113556-Pyramimonas_sp.AAC.1